MSMKAVSLVLTSLLVCAFAMPGMAANSPIASAAGAAPSRTLVDLDLSSTDSNLNAEHVINTRPVTICVGEKPLLVTSHTRLTAAEMLARLARFDQAQRRDLAWGWMAERDPEETVREILRAAASMSPRMRWLAADVAEEAGEEALPAWREALSEPLLAVHARCALIAWDDAPELTSAEQLWLAVEAAAAGLEERGPDEALCCLWERVPGTSLDDRLAAIRSNGHPAAAEVAGAVADLAATLGLRSTLAGPSSAPAGSTSAVPGSQAERWTSAPPCGHTRQRSTACHPTG